METGYNRLRYSFSRCENFADFARFLALEFKNCIEDKRGTLVPTKIQGLQKATPLYVYDVANTHNNPINRVRCLNVSEEDQKVACTYCTLCSYNHTETYRNKPVSKKGGSKTRTWCLLCRQAICKACRDVWNSTDKLRRVKFHHQSA